MNELAPVQSLRVSMRASDGDDGVRLGQVNCFGAMSKGRASIH